MLFYPPRLVDCRTVSKDSSHHLIGNVFSNTRTLRNKTAIDFNDIPVLLLGFTASLREQASIFKLSPFTISTRDHRVNVRKYTVGFITPLSRNEEIIVLDHLCKIVRGERTYLNSNENSNAVEQDVDLPLDVTEVEKSVAIQLNHQLAQSIYQSIILNTKLDLTLHFTASHVARSEITFASKTLYCNGGIPTVAELLEIISSSGKFNTKKSLKPETLWNILRKFRINFHGFERQSKPMPQKQLIVDIMHGAVHYKDNTYWRFCSNWYLVSSDRLAVVQHKFRKLIQNNLMSEGDPAYLSKKFPPPTKIESDSDTQPSTSTVAITQDSQKSESLSQQSGRDYLEYDYNCKYATDPDFLVGDRLKANHIEIFDLLRYDRDNGKVWIYHVKRKFGQSTRDAASQLAVSAKLIYDDTVGSGEKTLHKHYIQLADEAEINAKLVQWGITSGEEYVNMFRKNKLIFVYAFVDEDNKSTKRTLKEESQKSASIKIADLKEKLEAYKSLINDSTNFKSIIHKLYRLVFDLDIEIECDSENLERVAENMFEFLVKSKLIGSNGNVTGKLLFGINFNQLGNISQSALQFQEFLLKFSAKINFFEFFLKPYRSLYQTLIAKIELQRIHKFIVEMGFDFQICEIEKELTNVSAPTTPLTKGTLKRDCSRSNSSVKRQKTTGSSSKKKEIPKGQRLIPDLFKNVSRKLSLDSNVDPL